PQDGVASTGTLSRLDQLYQHELLELAARAFSGTLFDPGPRQAEREDLLPGLAVCAFQDTQMVEVGYLVALPIRQRCSLPGKQLVDRSAVQEFHTLRRG